MYCTHCGAKIDDNARFCSECGKSVAGEPAPQRDFTPHRQPSSSQPRVPEYIPEPAFTRRKNTSFKKPQFKKEGSGEGSKFFFKILAAAIVVLVAYLGYDYFANGVGGGDEVVKKTSKPYFHLNEEDKDTNQASSTGTEASGSFNFTREELADLSPSSPSLIGIHMTRSEIESVAPITAKVSPENPTCQVGGITVKFNSFDLDEEDTFQLRQLGTRQDQATGSELTLYDFSLASGKHEFSGDVAITIPRSQDGRGDGIYYYNEIKKVWESTSYDISSDGKNYILYTNHFTPYTERCWMAPLSPEESRKVYGQIEETENRIRQKQGFYAIAHPENYEGKNLLRAPLFIDSEKFHDIMEPSAKEKIKLSKYLTDQDRDALEMNESLSLYLGGLYDVEGQINSASTLLFDSFFSTFSDINSGLDAVLRPQVVLAFSLKLADAMASDKGFWKTVGNNHGDILSILSWLIPSSATFATPAGWLLAAYSIFGSDFIDNIKYYHAFQPEAGFEYHYHWYLSWGNWQKDVYVNLDGKGWKDLVIKIVEEEISSGSVKIDNIENALEKEFQTFVQSYWDNSAEDRVESFKSYIRSLRKNGIPGTPELPALVTDPEKVKYYQERALEKVKYSAASAVSAAIQTLPAKLTEQMINEFNQKILPYRNTVLRFRVNNAKLLTNGTFDKSPYAKGRIHFDGLTDAIFYPGGTKQSSYPKELFTPEPHKDSNEILICRRYVYELYGMPKSITFEGVDGVAPITLKVKDTRKTSRGKDYVLISLEEEINEQVDLTPFLGNWEVVLDEGTENETTEIISLKEGKDKKHIEISSRRKTEKYEYSYDSKSGRLKSSGKEGWLENGNLHAIVDGKSYILHRPKKKKVVCPDCGGEDGNHSPDCISPFNVRMINL